MTTVTSEGGAHRVTKVSSAGHRPAEGVREGPARLPGGHTEPGIPPSFDGMTAAGPPCAESYPAA